MNDKDPTGQTMYAAFSAMVEAIRAGLDAHQILAEAFDHVERVDHQTLSPLRDASVPQWNLENQRCECRTVRYD